MSDTEIRMMRYTIEQLSAELQASRQYASDIKSKLDRTRKALDVALDWLGQVATPEKCDDDLCREFTKQKLAEIESITKGGNNE